MYGSEDNDRDATSFDGAHILSDVARRRCDAMLPFLQSAVVREGRRRRRRRSVRRSLEGIAVLLLIGVGLTRTWSTFHRSHVLPDARQEPGYGGG